MAGQAQPAGAENWPHFSQLKSEDPNRLSGVSRCLCSGLLVSHGGTAPFFSQGSDHLIFPSCPAPSQHPLSDFCHTCHCPELPILSPALTPQPLLKKQFWPRGIRVHVPQPPRDVTAPSSPLRLLQEETEQPTVSYSFWQAPANPFGRVSPASSPQTPQGLSSYFPNTSTHSAAEPNPPSLGHQSEVVRTT